MSYRCEQKGCSGRIRLVSSTCREDIDIDARLGQRTLQDRLIFLLQDQTMQREVLKEKLNDLQCLVVIFHTGST